jgi:hypothetical protein
MEYPEGIVLKSPSVRPQLAIGKPPKGYSTYFILENFMIYSLTITGARGGAVG